MLPEDKLNSHFRIMPVQERALSKLRIETVLDLLYHFPARYGDAAGQRRISEIKAGETATVFGLIKSLKTSKAYKKKIPMAEAVVEDDTGRAKVVWFHQPYLAKMLAEGSLVRIEGKVSERKGELYFSNPKVEPVSKIPEGGRGSLFGEEEHSLYPVYPESRGISSNWMHHKIQHILSSGLLDELEDPIPESILRTYNLPNLKTSLIWIHSPKKEDHALAARKRMSFEEIFMIQLERQLVRAKISESPAFVIKKSEDEMEKFVSRFPFEPTESQRRAISEVLKDFSRPHPMGRLLEGDVGSGKTAVAAAASYAAASTHPSLGTKLGSGSLQTAYMAPTEILAQQHFESFIQYFRHMPINVGLITGSGCRKFPSKVDPSGWTTISRSQLLKWVESGEIAVLVGTHALIAKSVKFKHLALVVIDEQHRFGTSQRQKLVNKDERVPHLLSMTATPIPRTLALTIYGDLDISLLDQMPAGRKKIITKIVTPEKRAEAYETARRELATGRQMYVICPRISEPDPDKEKAVLAKSVKEEAKRLKKEVFPDAEIGILHGKMKPGEKERTMLAFKDGELDILVATSVVEVGVNVENASLIVIEGAERFGLAQLHQLRGRVLRGTHQPYCFVFSETRGDKTVERLKALETARNGFELAELDLANRGAGELAGTKQWGISDLGMEAIKNIRMVEAARTEATELVEKDPGLKKHPLIAARLASSGKKIHFE